MRLGQYRRTRTIEATHPGPGLKSAPSMARCWSPREMHLRLHLYLDLVLRSVSHRTTTAPTLCCSEQCCSEWQRYLEETDFEDGYEAHYCIPVWQTFFSAWLLDPENCAIDCNLDTVEKHTRILHTQAVAYRTKFIVVNALNEP